MARAEGRVAEQLRALAVGYASAVDRRDGAALRRLFAADGTLTVRDASGGVEVTRLVGDEIAGIAEAIARYPVTFHLLGQSTYEVAGDEASGEVYCEAHHHVGELGGEAVDHVMYIRYHDAYLGHAGDWVIADRVVEILWAVDVAVTAPGRATGSPA